jgi:hypothetical protein
MSIEMRMEDWRGQDNKKVCLKVGGLSVARSGMAGLGWALEWDMHCAWLANLSGCQE